MAKSKPVAKPVIKPKAAPFKKLAAPGGAPAPLPMMPPLGATPKLPMMPVGNGKKVPDAKFPLKVAKKKGK